MKNNTRKQIKSYKFNYLLFDDNVAVGGGRAPVIRPGTALPLRKIPRLGLATGGK
jgi:hypothetical protein